MAIEAERERGMVFCNELRPGARAGLKTVTRRVIVPHRRSAYQVGDRLYLKEPLFAEEQSGQDLVVCYVDDGTPFRSAKSMPRLWLWKVRSLAAIYMPRWAARTWLGSIESMREECLHAITPEDVRLEGGCDMDDPLAWFRALWDRVNSARGTAYRWCANPSVWRIEWKRPPCAVQTVEGSDHGRPGEAGAGARRRGISDGVSDRPAGAGPRREGRGRPRCNRAGAGLRPRHLAGARCTRGRGGEAEGQA